MGLELKISNTEVKDATYFDLADITGTYNAITNPVGWNAPNVPTSSVTTILISIVLPGETTTTYFTFIVAAGVITSLTRTNRDGSTTVMAPFTPTTFDENFKFRIYASYFGLTSFEDGYNAIKYTVSGTHLATPYSYFAEGLGDAFFVANIICCKNTKLSQAALKGGCGCTDSRDLLNLDLYIKEVVASAACGKINVAKNALTLAQGICTGGCEGC